MARARSVVPALTVLAAAGLLGGCAASSGQQPASGTASGTASRAVAVTSAGGPTASAGSRSRGTASAAGGSPAAGASAAACAGLSVAAPAAASSGTPALAAVQFTDADHGWVAGAGRIMATSDGGRSWTRQYSGSADLSQVDFTDAAHGWAAGGLSCAPLTGAQLDRAERAAGRRPLPDGQLGALRLGRPRLRDRRPPSRERRQFGRHLRRCGRHLLRHCGRLGTPASGGELLVTTDGGATWSQVTAAPAAQSACFGTAQDGYVGASGRIWRTTDAGKTWALAFTEPQASAVSQSAGASSAGGQSAGDTPEFECAGQSAAWVLFLGDGAAMMHSPYLAYATEQGTAWHGVLEETMLESALRPKLHLPAGPGSEPGPFSAISSTAAVFVGYTPPDGFGAAPVALASGGGTTLTSAGNVAAINQPLAAAFLTPARGWVVGENLKSNTFAVEATTDGGHSLDHPVHSRLAPAPPDCPRHPGRPRPCGPALARPPRPSALARASSCRRVPAPPLARPRAATPSALARSPCPRSCMPGVLVPPRPSAPARASSCRRVPAPSPDRPCPRSCMPSGVARASPGTFVQAKGLLRKFWCTITPRNLRNAGSFAIIG